MANGTIVADRTIFTVAGTTVALPDPEHVVHLQFRRFAGCPVCNIHLRSIVRRHDAIVAAGIREVVVFHSTAAELLVHVPELPFAVVADPEKELYREFGVESGRRALLDPRAWLPILRAVISAVYAIVRKRSAVPPADPRGGRLGLPADFLIARDGRIIARKYGDYVDDQWSVDELLALAASMPAPAMAL